MKDKPSPELQAYLAQPQIFFRLPEGPYEVIHFPNARTPMGCRWFRSWLADRSSIR